MANIFLSIEHGVAVAAEDVLKFITGAEQVVQTIAPGAIAGLATILGAVGKVAVDVEAVAGAPLNVTFDEKTFADIKAVWPAIEAFAKSIGIKL